MQNGKDTVYVDIDDEITAIIDKVTGSKQKVVALILPKRAGVLQSSVNMKLLKRSADNVNKNVVLVTTEAALMPLAGAAGVHVAKTPLSKPEIPVNPIISDNQSAIDEDEALELDDEPEAEYTADNAANRPVGELATGAATGAAIAGSKKPNAIETVELDDVATPAKAAAATDVASKKAAKASKSKQNRIPNFGKFQKRIVAGIVLLFVLIAGVIFAAIVLPKATIAISTDATDYNSSQDVTLDSAATKVSTDSNTVPATMVQQQKVYSQQVPATGQQNNGQKATGSVKIINCGDTNVSIPAGTGFSSGSHTYISQSSTTVPQSNYQFKNGTFTCKNDGNATVDITAQKPGSDYNMGSTSMSFSGSSSTVTANGSASGGTDNIVKAVSQADITNAQNQIKSQDTSSIKSALTQQLRSSNLYPIDATFGGGDPTSSNSAEAGDATDTVTVSQTVNYTMYGAKRDYLDQLIKNDIKQQIDPNTQTILDDGLDSASIKSTGSSDTTNKINVATTATVGPNINTDKLKDQIKGKKTGYVKSLIGNQPGVTNVEVKLSPFWVSSVPKSTDKITITVGKSSNSDGGN